MGTTGRVRFSGFAAALAATAVLLTGCGDADTDSGAGSRAGTSPEPGRTQADQADRGGPAAARLTPEQTVAALPRADDLVDWSLTSRPTAEDLTKKAAMCTGVSAWCKGALQMSSAFFTHRDAGHIEFTVYAYGTSAAATAAYPLVLKDLEIRELDPKNSTEVALPTRVGDAALAKQGTTRLNSPGTLLSAAAGTTVVTVRTGGLAAMSKTYTPKELAALGTLLADRSRQVQGGGPATLDLPEGALTYEKKP
ncbi:MULTISPECIES: hypothetical protein [Streptomyces]|uniref:Lipoprotein n=1 Tax=Streptomyces tsukubensis (strain DSM 42081 / NBRC 108919 / NRRL 18488 / 9993) TaxID=1114943 RepID=I2N295_STRT9|nr:MULTISPECIES: hypothetical protein [Streptomyces]AZK95283.1 hypothetical protein B7R87_16545 [Streptomyces tsukubensis]EIF91142.1 hypothetical protein [Streptomyces tsukubensis NRRL18488]MYS62912.1 hypothetical protein [Streptomyces sp. SID5473]QKM68660.1 hypothetical protein STSU_017250 [Streptomyces tsukubensis NRRL18488]TAI43466.1 hypothetical protein EWI31_17000 [Streptomyces tsukubensis]